MFNNIWHMICLAINVPF